MQPSRDIKRTRKQARTCQTCQARPAGYVSPTSGRWKYDTTHDQCRQCYRAAMNRARHPTTNETTEP